MGLTYIKKMPEVEDLLKTISLSDDLKEIKARRDCEIKNVFRGKSDLFILIIGPCSAHDEDAVCDYVGRLAHIQEKVKEKLLIIPRIYTNKPRTTGEGYKGMLHQPELDKSPSIIEGLKAIRRMQIRALSESHLPAADEMLYPDNTPYIEDILSYVAVGARSVENQQHRLVASGLPVPVGMKNPTSGDIAVMINSIKAAQIEHDFFYNRWEVKTSGNPLTHGILRGSINQYGRAIPNYHYEDVVRCYESCLKAGLTNPAVIIDANHSNSNKEFLEQPRIAREIIDIRKYNSDLKKFIKGLMIESYIQEGQQAPSGTEYGMSITDPCLGWEQSEQLILEIAEQT